MAGPVAVDPNISFVLKRPFAEQAAFFRGKMGNLLPSESWRDVMRGQHDRGFMVAGATKADLLADLASAVDRAITEGKSLDAFRKDFDAIVQRRGWSHRGGRNWRTRVIYSTNMTTSYSAGRLAQLREGGFPFWMYKHADGVARPRPLHVSWNGLVLAATDEWWKVHFPPNDWGCHCRVIGLGDPEDAEDLGGRVAPAPNDGIDPKTGLPSGVGEGWDYMPGDTVSGTVRAMAEKTQQWDYTLGKAYMQDMPEGVRDALVRSYRELPSVADDTRRYAKRVLDMRKDLDIPPYRTLGLVTSKDAERVSELIGKDVALSDFALSPSAIRHVHRAHGDVGKEASRGQRAVTATDYARLPELLNSPDGFEANEGNLIFRKAIEGEEFTAVFEVLTKRRMLGLKTFWIKSKAASR